MKRILALVLIFVMLASFAACSSGEGVEIPDDMQLASDTEVSNWYFFVPSGWSVTTTGTFSMAYVPIAELVSVSFTDFSAAGYTSAEEYWDGSFDKLKNIYSDLEMIEEAADTTLSGYAAKRYVYTATYGGDNIKFMQILMYKNGSIYSFMYSADVEVYDTYASYVDKMLEEFMFKHQAED